MLDKYLPCFISFSPTIAISLTSLTVLVLFDFCLILQCDYLQWVMSLLSLSGVLFNFCKQTCLKDLSLVSRRAAFKSRPLRHGFYFLSIPPSRIGKFPNSLNTRNHGKNIHSPALFYIVIYLVRLQKQKVFLFRSPEEALCQSEVSEKKKKALIASGCFFSFFFFFNQSVNFL